MVRLAFGGFELDPISGELRKGETCVRIQEQPLKFLLCLLERPGQLVTREELQRRVWGEEVHVAYGDSLNAAAWRLRQALGDSAEKPLFIETVPRKGYRFVGKVLPLPGNPPPASGSFPMPVVRPDSGPAASEAGQAARPARRRFLWIGAALAIGLVTAGFGLWTAFRPHPVRVGLPPLVNGTGDPAVDYFASALTRQVGLDLRQERGVEVVLLTEADPSGSGDAPPLRAPDLSLEWVVVRESQEYRISVRVKDNAGRPLGQAVFRAGYDGLHDVHRNVAAYLATQAEARREGRL